MGVQVGERNTQIIYTYNRLTWTDGVAPPPLISVSGWIESPYRGLSAFEEQDAAFFFGRDMAVSQVLERMSRSLNGPRLLVVSGVSGAGKSSLLRAGLLPRLRGAGLASAPGSASWPCLVFTPTRAPLDELALRVARLAGVDGATVRRGLDADPEGFALTARQAALAPIGPADYPAELVTSGHQQRLLLVVDQFEQLFTQCPDEGQRRAFITALCAAAGTGDAPGRAPAAQVVLGVRADFEAQCANYPQLAGAVQNRYLVTPMTERQLRLAITEPAAKAGSRVADDLVEVLLAEVQTRQPGRSGAGVLPLLSHALDQAWRSRIGETLTLADYERTGGIEGAVADSAQRVYDSLTPAQQAAARPVFLRLTATSSDGIVTADRSTRGELTEGKSPAEVRDVDALLEAFAAERLLTMAADSVEISHEVLLTAWPMLRDTWLAETQADRIIRTQIRNVAGEWAGHSRDSSYLYRGTLLQAAAETAAKVGADPARNPPLSQTERDFLHASDGAHRRTARRRRAVIAGLLILTSIAVATAGLAVDSAANASQQHAIALSRQLAAESLTTDVTDPVTARQLAVAAWSVSPTDQAYLAMQDLLAEQQQGMLLATSAQNGVAAVAFSPDGKLLASAEGDGTVRLWNPVTGQPGGKPVRADSVAVDGLAFSPDGKLLATAGFDGVIRLWNPSTGQAVGTPLQAGDVIVNAVAFSADGKLLASADDDGTVRLWNLAVRRPFGTLRVVTDPNARVIGVAFSPDDRLLATTDSDGIVRLWNPATRQSIATLRADTGSNADVDGIAFSPDSKLLASVNSDGVQFWNPSTGHLDGAPLAGAAASGGYGTEIAFSPDGSVLASAYSDGTLRLWNTVTGRPVGSLIRAVTGPDASVNGIAFSPDGKLLASADSDGTVRLWNPATGLPASSTFLRLATGPVGVTTMAFSPDGKLVASTGSDGTVRLWNPASALSGGTLFRAVNGPAAGVYTVAFSPDGKLLASGNSDGTVRLWNAASRQAAGILHAVSGPNAGVYAVTFSPDGKLLASGDSDGTVRLWNPATRQPAGTLRAAPGGSVDGVAFSPDGKLLASAGSDGTVRLWDPATRQSLRTVRAATDSIGLTDLVAFSPDGKLLAGTNGGTVQLWILATGQPVGPPLPATHAVGGVSGMAFSPDGKLLATTDSDGTVRLWNPATSQAVGTAFPGTGTYVGGPEGLAFSPDGDLLASADAGTLRLWDLSPLTRPYASLCRDVGPLTRQAWEQYAPGEPIPRICA